MKYMCLMIIITLLMGCSTMAPVDLSEQHLQSSLIDNNLLNVSDNVRIQLMDGTIHDVTVTGITANSIRTNGGDYLIGNIVKLEKKNFSTVKTTGAVAGVIIAIGALALNVLDNTVNLD